MPDVRLLLCATLRSVLMVSSITTAVVAGVAAQMSLASADDAAAAVTGMIRHGAEHVDGRAAHSFDHSAWSGNLSELPIGVFDSGIGGLTVLEAILQLDAFHNDNLQPVADGRPDFQNERFVYFGDQANMPYGNYPAAGKESFLRELILKDAVFLLGRRYWSSADASEITFDKPPVKAIVIACNTATAYGLKDIRDAVREWNIPVIVVGVVEAGSRGVAEVISGDGSQHTVAVLATVGTCSSMAWPKTIGSTFGLAGKRLPVVIQQGSASLAGAIEGDPSFVRSDRAGDSLTRTSADPPSGYQGPASDSLTAPLDVSRIQEYDFDVNGLTGDISRPSSIRLNSVENYVRYEVTTLVQNYHRDGGSQAIDTVVLACTHFPLVEQEILRSFDRLRNYEKDGNFPYRRLIAEKMSVVDPAEMTAKELFRSLAKARLLLKDDQTAIISNDQFFMSVPAPGWPNIRLSTDGSLDREYKYGRSVSQLSDEDTRNVPVKTSLLPATSLNLIRERLPKVWQRLKEH